MSTNNPNSRRAARSDAGAASAGKPPEADRAPAGGTGPAVPPAGPDPILPNAGGPTIDLTAAPAGDGLRPVPLHTDTSFAAMTPAAAFTEIRPQDAARTLAAAAGSATEAPSLGAGALGDVAGGALTDAPGATAVPTEKAVGAAEGLPPGCYSATGAHGGFAEVPTFGPEIGAMERRLFLAAADYVQPFTGAKMAVGRPETPEALDDCRAAGFDFEVTSRQLNFRRAGVVHPITPTLRRSQDFTAGEMELLRSEPLLVVRGL